MNKLQQTVTGDHIRSLTLSVGLLDRLLPRSRSNRYTRVEAYRYLLSRLTDQALGQQTLLGVELDIEPGQVIITDSELAQTWGWHRATVKSFLLELEDLSVLTMRRETKFSVLTFPAVQKKIAAEITPPTPMDKHQMTTSEVIHSEVVVQSSSVSQAKNSKSKTSIKNSRTKSSSASTPQVPSLLLQAPSLFDGDALSVLIDETLDENSKSKSDDTVTVVADETAEQNLTSVTISPSTSPLELSEQKSSVSDCELLTYADNKNTDDKSEFENPSAEEITPNNDASDEA